MLSFLWGWVLRPWKIISFILSNVNQVIGMKVESLEENHLVIHKEYADFSPDHSAFPERL